VKAARPAAAVRHWLARALGDWGHWGHGSKAGTCLHYRGTDHGVPAEGPKAGTGLHWGHGVPAEGRHWGTECPA